MKNFIQRSFRRELLVSFLAVSVLPLIVCCVFLIQMFKVKKMPLNMRPVR